MKKILHLMAAAMSALVVTSCGGSGNSSSLDYVAVQTSENAKWSMLGPDGKLLYEEEFENMPSPVVNGFFTVSENGGISVYKATSKKPELVKGCEDLVSAGYMTDGVIPVTRKNERIKLVDGSGKEVLTFMPVDGEEIVTVSSEFVDGAMLFMTSAQKFGLISKKGEVLVSPKYDDMQYAKEDMVFAQTNETDSAGNPSSICYLLDKKGKEIVKFKDNVSMYSAFEGGKALVKKGEDQVPGYINKKGEFTKLPAKVAAFGDFFNGKEFTFVTEDNKTGLMNIEGEILIRPKYDYINIYHGDKFYAKDDDSKYLILSKTGEKEETYDDFKFLVSFQALVSNTKFEVLAYEKDHRADFYKFDGKPITQESFYEVNFGSVGSLVFTDYFNAEAVGEKMASLIQDNGVAGVAFGTEVGKVLPKGAEAKNYSNESVYMLPDINGGYDWSLSIAAEMTEPIAHPVYTTVTEGFYFRYTRQVVSGYEFNKARVSSFSISAGSERDFTAETSKAVVANLTKRGFKQTQEVGYVTTLEKGNMIVNISRVPDEFQNELVIAVSQKAAAPASADEPASDSVSSQD